MSSGPVITLDQVAAAKDDLVALVRRGVGALSPTDAPRITIDVCVLVAYPTQWLRDRNESLPDPPVRFSGVEDRALSVIYSQLCEELDPDGAEAFRESMKFPAVSGVLSDWLLSQAMAMLLAWLEKQVGEGIGLDVIADLVEWVKDQLSIGS